MVEKAFLREEDGDDDDFGRRAQNAERREKPVQDELGKDIDFHNW